jgi:pimeloyl-ACP methyl ester carboxylesterase
MKTRRFAYGLLAVAVVAVVTTAAATSGAAARSPAYTVDWAPCAGSPAAQCGTMEVPIDWSRPQGPKVHVAVARHPASDPDHRIGTLYFNPGGPGDPSSRYVTQPEAVFPTELIARFDIVGLDPRATGNSVQVHCGVPVLTPQDTLYPRTEQAFQAMVRHNRAVGLSCLRQTGPLMAHTDTVTLARDHEALRIALGARTVTWLGISYGTQVAANYAELYPQRTRAMVLDAALEHSQPEGVQVADEIMSAEDAFNRFAAWCGTAPSCALRGQDVGAVFDRLVADADAHPIPVEGAMRPVNGEDIRQGTVGLLRVKNPTRFFGELNWPSLSQVLAATLAGHADYFALPPLDAPQNGIFARGAIACLDYVPQVHTYAEMQQRIQMGRQLAPHLQGASETWQVNRCIGWPVPVANPPRLLAVHGVPALMVHAVHDASDPYKWAHSLAAQIEGIDLLTRTGDGHTSFHTSPCARAAIVAYLIRPDAAADRVCDE